MARGGKPQVSKTARPGAPGLPRLDSAFRNLPPFGAAFIVASATMVDKKRPNSSSSDKKSTKVPLAPAKPSKTPAPDEQADGTPKPTDTNTAEKAGANGNPAKANAQTGDGSSSGKSLSHNDGPSSSLRTYNI